MTPAATAPVKFAARNYIIGCIAVSLLYMAAAAARHWLTAQAGNNIALQYAAALVPAIPVWLLFVVVWLYYRAIDEFERHKFLVTLAVSFGIGCSLIVSYTFLTDAGLLRSDITWVLPILAVTWALTGVVRSFGSHL